MKASSLKKSFGAVLVVLLLAFTCVGTAFAYYTDTHRANGMVRLWTPPTTDITEETDGTGTNKLVTIKNTGGVDTTVRVKVFCATQNATLDFQGDSWSRMDSANADDEYGWFYYNGVLKPGEETLALKVLVTPTDNAPDEFDVAVIQQCSNKVASSTTITAIFGNSEIVIEGTNKLDPITETTVE